MGLPESEIRSLQAGEILLTTSRNAGKFDMGLPESEIRSLQAGEILLTTARTGKIDMGLPESEIRSLQAGENLLTAARRGGKMKMDKLETEIRRQAMAQVQWRSVEELAERDTAESSTTFTATEVDKHLDVMRREEFEEASKILDDYSDKSAIASIVKDKPPQKEMAKVKQQVHQCLEEVINYLDYQPTTSEQTHWRTSNLRAFRHYTTTHALNTAFKRHLLMTHTHKQKLKIILGLSIKDAHTFRCQMQDVHIKQAQKKKLRI